MSLTPHPHAEVIKAWADGHTIQVKTTQSDIFRDWTVKVALHAPVPDFNGTFEWRIKSPTKKYRVALLATPHIGRDATRVYAVNDAHYPGFDTQPDFIRWLTDWIEYEE